MNPGDVYRPPPGSGSQQENPFNVPPVPYSTYPPAGSNTPPAPQAHNPFVHPLEGDAGQYASPPPFGSTPSYGTPYGAAPIGHSAADLGYPPPSNYAAQEEYGDSAPLLTGPGGRPSGPGGIRFGASPSPSYQRLRDPQGPGGHFDNPYGNGPGDDGDSNVHYGALPTRMVRRNKTTKRVQLFRGHLVLDQQVPDRLLAKCPLKDDREFTHMRYTAVTCDPDEFVDDKYTLRQRLYEPARQTELFVVVTMYNEDDILFCRTMKGVMRNVAHLCTRDKSKTWGKEGWKKVVICIVSDGRTKINPRTRSVLAALGVYQEGVAKNVVNGKPVTAHLYEYTTQLTINGKGQIVAPEKDSVPIQLMFCLKEKNQKKINSHRWFFNAFGVCLNPTVCVLLDVGTEPGPTSIYHLWKAFDLNSSIGGACGEIVALKGQFLRNLLNPLVAAQNFEYKMSNILDKPLESIFGYITVLPGAFSAYRYIAIKNDARGEGPLEKYFYGETMHGVGAGIFKANMYLAEDRILCWELVSKRNSAWTLHYVKSAFAITDVPDTVPELVSQRRRWLNGSFFAAIHSIVHFGYLYRSSHGILRKFWLHIELLYQVINNVFAWFALGNYFIAFYVLVNSMAPFGKVYEIVGIVLKYTYLVLLLVCFILALGNRPQGSKWGYLISMIGFALITVYMVFCAVFLAIKGIQTMTQAAEDGSENMTDAIMKAPMFRNIVMSLLATYGLYIISSLISFDPWHLVTSFLQYLLIAPSYINVLNVYAFSNVHDVSWGTKGSDKASEELGVVKTDNKNEVEINILTEAKDIDAVYEAELRVLATKAPPEDSTPNAEQVQEDYYKNFRTNVLLSWTISNAALAAAIITIGDNQAAKAPKDENGYPIMEPGNVSVVYMGVMLYTVAGLALFRFIGACTYLLVRLFVGE